jgi:hypothetical protein
MASYKDGRNVKDQVSRRKLRIRLTARFYIWRVEGRKT